MIRTVEHGDVTIAWAESTSVKTHRRTGTWMLFQNVVEGRLLAADYEMWWAVVGTDVHELVSVQGPAAYAVVKRDRVLRLFVVSEVFGKSAWRKFSETLYKTEALARAQLAEREALSRAGLGVRPRALTQSPFAKLNLKK